MFVGGVGAFFHGDATDMERNLSGRMAGLPDSALLFCGCGPFLTWRFVRWSRTAS